MTRILNSPLVYPHLSGPPYPYQQSDAESFLLMISRACEDSLNEYLEILDGKSGRKWLSNGLPVRSIREEVADEKGEVEWRFLGDVEVRRALLVEVRDEDERERKKKVNDELEVGDEGVEWEVGYYLSPTHHSLGIMSSVLKTLLKTLAIPYLNARIIKGTFFEDNIGSKKVFEKNGFEFKEMVDGAALVPESKCGVQGGKRVGVGVMVWRVD